MNFAGHLKNCIWEWLLCTILSASLSMTIFHGFYIAAQRQNNYILVFGLAALITAGCVCGAYSKRSALISLAAGAAAAIICVIILQQRGAGGSAFRDEESNPYLFFLILVLTALAVFFLTRTRTGSGILFAAGAFLTGAIQFLYETLQLPVMLLFLCGGGTLYIYKNYQKNVLESETVKTAFSRIFALSAAACILVMGLSAGVYYGIIRPLDPPKQDLKLITKYMSLEILDQVGIADLNIVNDTDDRTDNINENEKESKKKQDKEDKSKGEKEQQKDENKKEEANNPSSLDDSQNRLLYAVKYSLSMKELALLIIPLFLLLILLAILIKLGLRRRWLNKVLQQPKERQISELYHFYLKKFRRLKLRKAPEETPFEFGQRAQAYLQAFETGTISFSSLTGIFVKTRYGQEPAEEEEYQSYLKFHRMFYKNCRKHLGNFKYILKFFTL